MNDKSNKTTSVNGASGGIGRAVAQRIACAGVAVAVQCLGSAAKVVTSLGAANVAKAAPFSAVSYAFKSASKRPRTSASPSTESEIVEAPNQLSDEMFRWEDDGGRVVD